MNGVFLTQKYSGEKNYFALIEVNYPSGSYCSCTNGTYTFTSEVGKTSYILAIPRARKWTINCSLNTINREIDIIEFGQYEIVKFLEEFDLFSQENGLSENYFIENTAIGPAIDVTGYSVLEIDGKITWASASTLGCKAGLAQLIDGNYLVSTSISGKKLIDISNVTGMCYFFADYPLSIDEDNLLVSSIKGSNGQGITVRMSSIKFK